MYKRQVLLWLNTRVGLLIWAMTLAAVKVLPEPVTPSSVLCFDPRRIESTSCAIASGWSPVGLDVYKRQEIERPAQSARIEDGY